MRLRTPLLTSAAFAFTLCVAAGAQEQQQQQDQQIIDDFVDTRGMSFTGPPRQTQKKRPSPAPRKGGTARNKKPAAGQPQTGVGAGKGGNPEAPAQTAGGAQVLQAGGALRPLALGYTVLMKDEADRLLVADTTREFKTDEQFAVRIETNADGYLYMFSAQNRRDPVLLFPDARVDGGANAVRAHTSETFPTPAGADAAESLLVSFTDPPGAEHLFIILSRRPLADVPVGEALVKFCGDNLEDCAWKPTAAQWARIIDGAKGRHVTEAKGTLLAQAVPPAMLRRGLKVRREDPKPSIVRVTDSSDADILVTEIVLTHK